ncbi:MAG TPA: CDP-diacylglycerol--glycerol-3-phosphate 3-phosphatidyltransferase [Elusimicrobiota bacterium]|nr:CDP-diacylglycerol--glycerol-3-phosphate 3-phosphatidyltransferase [Elusimicrobiota bacterium]
MNLANRLTVARFVMACAVFAALLRSRPAFHWTAFFIFGLAIATDWFDGQIARRMKKVSAFGKVADPIADKVLVLGALMALERSYPRMVPLWAVFLILARELLIGGLRVLSAVSNRPVAAEKWGKWKMGFQSFAVLTVIGILAAMETWPAAAPSWTGELVYGLTVMCVAASWSSAYFYYRNSRKLLETSWS